MNHLALFLHLIGALLFISGIVLAGSGFELARRRRRPVEMAALLATARVGVVLVAAGGLLVLVFGLLLVHLHHYTFGTGWISAAIALYLLVLVLGAVGGRQPKRARLLATKLDSEGAAASPELYALLNDRRSLVANYTSAILVFVILALMVFKP